MVLADTIWKGKPRKLLLSAQRSGVFYVLDRTSGEFLLANPFVKRITWADSFDPKTGKTLYRFRTNDSWRATPMTYMVDGRQYIAGMDGQVLWAFAQSGK